MHAFRRIPATHPTHWTSNVRHSMLAAALLVVVSLGVGIVGYHCIAALPWVDALLEASMILGGMGAISPMPTVAAKVFASLYALYSGLAIISTTGLLIAPWLQRMLYHTHRQARRDAQRAEGRTLPDDPNCKD